MSCTCLQYYVRLLPHLAFFDLQLMIVHHHRHSIAQFDLKKSSPLSSTVPLHGPPILSTSADLHVWSLHHSQDTRRVENILNPQMRISLAIDRGRIAGPVCIVSRIVRWRSDTRVDTRRIDNLRAHWQEIATPRINILLLQGLTLWGSAIYSSPYQEKVSRGLTSHLWLLFQLYGTCHSKASPGQHSDHRYQSYTDYRSILSD